MKKTTIFVLIIIFLTLIGKGVAMANTTSISGSTILDNILSGILNAIRTIAVVVVIVMFLWAGIMFATAAGDPTKLSKAKTAFLYGAIAVIVVIIATSIMTIIKQLTGL